MAPFKNKINKGLQRANNEKGFLIVGTLIFISLLMSFIFFLALSTLVSKKNSQIFKICLNSLWQIQTEQKNDLKTLLALNPEVKKWRALEKQAQEQLKKALLSAQPQLIAAAQAYLQFIQTQLVLIGRKQNLILLQAETKAKKKEVQSEIKFKKTLKEAYHNKAVQRWRSPLAVKSDQIGPKAAIYSTPINFSEKQKAQVAIYYSPYKALSKLEQQFLKYLPSLTPLLKPLKEIRCATSLEKRGREWHVYLVQQKI